MRQLMSQRKINVRAMHEFVNSKTKDGFRHAIATAIAIDVDTDDHLTSDASLTIPDGSIIASRTTVLRWMHVCNARYGRHVKGFTDRRNDGDIVLDRIRYSKQQDEYMKRQLLWTFDSNDQVVLADQCRSTDQGIEQCTDDAYSKFKCYFDAQGEEIPCPMFINGKCPAGHTQEKCRCQKKLIQFGHDEAVFWCNLQSGMEWTIDGERRLRPKTQGQGIMVSSIIDEQRGFGIPVTDDEWALLKDIYEEYHTQHQWFVIPEPLDGHRRQIGTVFFAYGSANTNRHEASNALRSGWWNCEKFKIQCAFLIACFEILYPGYQLLFQIDQSSGHMSKGGDTLDATHIGINDGGLTKDGKNKTGLRNTTVHLEDFGPYLGDGHRAAGMIDPSNPVQYGCYPDVGNEDDRYDACGPHYHQPRGSVIKVTVPAGWQLGMKLDIDLNNKATNHRIIRGCNVKHYAVDVPDTAAKVGETFEVDLLRKGHEWWRGMRKGRRQLLYEMGQIDPSYDAKEFGNSWVSDWGKKGKTPYIPSEKEARTKSKKVQSNGTVVWKKNATAFLQARRDFKEEKSVIEKLFVDAGHLVIASPKYHPEIAGLGIEYCWGKAKYEFRNNVNDSEAKNLHRNVLVSLGAKDFKQFLKPDGKVCAAPLPVGRVRKFARKARTYCNLFSFFPTPEKANNALRVWKADKKLLFTTASGEIIDLGIAAENETMYGMIERLYKKNKTHGNLIDMEYSIQVLH